MESIEDSSEQDSTCESLDSESRRSPREEIQPRPPGMPPFMKDKLVAAQKEAAPHLMVQYMMPARMKVLRRVAEDYAQHQLEIGNYAFFETPVLNQPIPLQAMHEFNEENRQLKKKTSRNAVATFVTVNPPDTTVEEFKAGVAQLIQQLMDQEVHGIFSVEQRSSDPKELKGFHIHVLLPNDVITKRKLEPIAGISFWGKKSYRPNDHHLNVRFASSDEDVERMRLYIDPAHQQKPKKEETKDADERLRDLLEFTPTVEF